jgi:hypothetical protein
MRPTVVLLLAFGFILGPAYYAYCLLISGDTARSISMTERASRWTTADGSILRFSNGLAYKPVTLLLDPEMNSVMLRLEFNFDQNGTEAPKGALKYEASLAEGDQTVLERPIQLQEAESGTQTVDIGPLDVPYAADYMFLLVEVGNVATPAKINLDVIEKMQKPVMSIVWTGMGLLIGALIFSLRDVIRTATRQGTPR